MRFIREIHEQYRKAYAMADRCQQRNTKQRFAVCPVALDSLLNERMVSYRLNLGIMEIPTELIVGVAEKSDRMMLFTKEFLPLSAPNTEEAEQWRQAYQELSGKKTNREQLTCLEYLGKFYVSEGLMKASAAKFMGIAMIQAQVVRVMPVKTDSIEVQRYYEFLARYQLTGLYQLQFTQPGCFEEIGRAFGKRTAEEWSGADQTAFLKIWPKVENAFRSSYADYLPITAADAFAVLLRRFSLHQLMRMDTWILARVFQANWKELYSLNQTDAMMQPKETCLQVLQTA